MKRGFLLFTIIAMVVIVFAYQNGTGHQGKSKTQSDNLTRNKHGSEVIFPQKLKIIIMPATDIIEQVRDIARAVAAGDTNPGLALSVYAKADEYLTDTRVKIDEINATGAARRIKDKSDKIIIESVKNVDDLIYLTKANNKEKLEGVAKELDSDLAELRRLFKEDPETKD